VSQPIEAVLPFRLDDEALDIAFEARSAGLGTLWIGEMKLILALEGDR